MLDCLPWDDLQFRQGDEQVVERVSLNDPSMTFSDLYRAIQARESGIFKISLESWDNVLHNPELVVVPADIGRSSLELGKCVRHRSSDVFQRLGPWWVVWAFGEGGDLRYQVFHPARIPEDATYWDAVLDGWLQILDHMTDDWDDLTCSQDAIFTHHHTSLQYF